MAEDSSGRSLGGHARAAVLTPERRREIARMGGQARWSGEAKTRRQFRAEVDRAVRTRPRESKPEPKPEPAEPLPYCPCPKGICNLVAPTGTRCRDLYTPNPEPLIRELFALLPEPGAVWPVADRVRWLRLVVAAFDFLYGPAPGITIGGGE